MYEREQAIGRYVTLKKQIYELGVKAQSLVNDIQQETAMFLEDKDFSSMDFRKVAALAVELQKMQDDYNEKVGIMNRLRETYNITE